MPHPRMAPISIEIPIRNPAIAPNPTIRTDGSSAKPKFAAETLKVLPLAPATVVLIPGARGLVSNGMTRNFSAALNPAVKDKSRKRAWASCPPLWISPIVSAVTMPAGNGRYSRTSSWLRSPAATTIPRRLTTSSQIASTANESVCPVSKANAGIGAARPADMIEAEADAAVWFMLFSRSPQAGVAPNRSAAAQNANPIRPAATDMLNVHPILRPL
jgi:hypothetical protein